MSLSRPQTCFQNFSLSCCTYRKSSRVTLGKGRHIVHGPTKGEPHVVFFGMLADFFHGIRGQIGSGRWLVIGLDLIVRFSHLLRQGVFRLGDGRGLEAVLGLLLVVVFWCHGRRRLLQLGPLLLRRQTCRGSANEGGRQHPWMVASLTR